MSREWGVTVVTGTCMLLVGCATTEPTIVKGPRFDTSTHLTYMILPFTDANETRYKLLYANATTSVRDAFETAFLEKGSKVIPCSEPTVLLSDIHATSSLTNFQQTVSVQEQCTTEERGLEVGKRAGADVVVSGTVTAFYRGTFAGNYTTVGFSVKATDTRTKDVLWKAALTRKTKWDYKYDPGTYAQEITRGLVGSLVVSK